MIIVVKLFKQNHVQYGLLLSGVTAICLTLMTVGGTGFGAKSLFQQFFMILMPFIILYLGIHAKKREGRKHFFSYKNGLAEGMKISAVHAVVSPLVFWVFYVLINPSLLDYVRGSYRLGNISNSAIISVDMSAQFVGALLVGLIYSAIIAYFVRSKK